VVAAFADGEDFDRVRLESVDDSVPLRANAGEVEVETAKSGQVSTDVTCAEFLTDLASGGEVVDGGQRSVDESGIRCGEDCQVDGEDGRIECLVVLRGHASVDALRPSAVSMSVRDRR
jgi:hypothetical protein